jgi:hypothetical protein
MKLATYNVLTGAIVDIPEDLHVIAYSASGNRFFNRITISLERGGISLNSNWRRLIVTPVAANHVVVAEKE